MNIMIKWSGKTLAIVLTLLMTATSLGNPDVLASSCFPTETLAMSERNMIPSESAASLSDESGLPMGPLGYVHPFIDPSYLQQGAFPETLARIADNFPMAYDIREHDMVTSAIRNQTSWGTCWAFAATGAAESSLYPNDSTAFSPRHLAYFTYHGAANPTLPEDGTDGDTFLPYAYHAGETSNWWYPWYEYGGNSFMSNATLSRIGIQTDTAVPYPESYDYFDTKKRDFYGTPALKEEYTEEYGNVSESYHFTAPYRLIDSNYLPTRDESGALNGSAIKSALMNGYSISVAYASGSYNAYPLSDGANIVAQQYNGPGRVGINHAVQIVGWNDSIPKEAFCTKYENGTPAGKMPENNGGWLVRNSWGENWGMNGCFYLSYEDSSISETCQFIASADQPFDHQYQYDGTGWNTTIGVKDNPTKSAYMSNVFTATSDETLKAVAFYTTCHNASYAIQIYTNLTRSNDPSSGTPAFSEEQKGTQIYAGYHIVDLNLPVNVDRGTPFAVVIRIQNPSADNQARPSSAIYPVACELNGYCDGVVCEASIHTGESFISFNGEDWLDLTDYGKTQQSRDENDSLPANICLKAFTVDGHESKIPLIKAIEEAKEVMDQPKYFNASTKEAFDRALGNAEALVKQPSVAAEEIIAAIQALQTAKEMLNGKPTDLTTLQAAISSAESIKKTPAYLYDGGDKKAALDSALEKAKQILLENSPTQAKVDHIKAMLETAQNALNGEIPIDVTALQAAIASAEAVKRTDAYLYDSNVKKRALDSALENARTVLKNPHHTQQELDHAKESLDIVRAVLNGKNPGDK